MHGKDPNAIYNGYSFQPLILGHSYATSFQHYYDFEPHWKNHIVPHYGIFSRFYFGRMLKSVQGQDEKYSSFKKSYGPPFYQFNPRVAPIEHDPFLIRRGIPASSMRMFEAKDRTEHALDAHHSETPKAIGH
jgi:hypothetical protein